MLVDVIRVLVLVAVAACYRPAQDSCIFACGSGGSCPAGYHCSNTFCAFGTAACSPDGGVLVDNPRVDAPPPCTLPGSIVNDTALTPGLWFGADLGADRYAIKNAEAIDGLGVPRASIWGTNGDVTSGATSYRTIFPGSDQEVYPSSRLGFDGRELFARVDTTTGRFIATATRTAGTDTWSALTKLDLRDPAGSELTVQPGADPGMPTQTDPRRLVLAYGAEGFDELVENRAAGTWELEIKHENPAYGVPFFGHAHLTPDGLRLVFASETAGIGSIYVVERPVLDSTFAGPAIPIATGGSAFRPFLVPDCTTMFYDTSTDVRMATY